MTVRSRIPLEFESKLLYRGRIRPGGEALSDREAVQHWRDETFKPTTDTQVPQAWVLNLQDVSPSAEALHDLVVPLGTGVRDGRYGPSALFVATGSEQIRDMLAALAERYRFPIFLLRSINQSLLEAEPVGPVQQADRTVLDFTAAMGGVTTSNEFAKANRLELAAASNRLAGAAERNLVARIERPRRRGNQFVDLRAAFAPRHEGAFKPFSPDVGDLDPAQLNALVQEVARAEDRPASEVMAEMLRAYLAHNYERESGKFDDATAEMRSRDNDSQK